MEKKIKIENNKVVVYNDNAIRKENGEVITNIKGDYSISADDVLALIALTNDNTHVLKTSKWVNRIHEAFYGNFVDIYDSYITFYSKDANMTEEFNKIIDSYTNEIKSYINIMNKLKKTQDKLIDLIKKHNANTGFFGKKIDISNIDFEM